MTPDTILRWYRRLVAKKYDGSHARRPGRPSTKPDIAALVVRMAKENPTWGYARIRGGLKSLGHEVARNTIKPMRSASLLTAERGRRIGAQHAAAGHDGRHNPDESHQQWGDEQCDGVAWSDSVQL